MCRYVSDYEIENVNGHFEVFRRFDHKFMVSADTLLEAYDEIDELNVDKTRKAG